MGGDDLTKKEIKEVRRIWTLVTSSTGQHPGQHGVEILLKLFTMYPEYKLFWKKLKDISAEDLRHTPLIRVHASSLMHGITTFIDKIDDRKSLVKLLHRNVDTHYGRKVRYEQYRNALSLIPSYLEETLASNMSTEAITGWSKVVDLLCTIIKQRLDSKEKCKQEVATIGGKVEDKQKNGHDRCCIS